MSYLPTCVPDRDVIAAGVLLRRDTARGTLWLLLKDSGSGEWGFPKGHSDPGETLLATALRECAEECGIAVVAIDGPAREVHYRLGDGRRKCAVYFPAVTSTERVELSAEHVDWLWADSDEVIRRLAHANLRALFRAAVAADGLPRADRSPSRRLRVD